MSNSEDKLLTPEETAERLGVSESTLDSWRVRRVHLDFVKIGRLVRYRASEIARFVCDQTKKAGAA